MSERGFSLVELMTVLGILSILAGIGVGIGPGIIQTVKERAELRGFISDCRKAQMLAIKTNQSIVLTAQVGAPGTYQLFVDENKNFILDAGEHAAVDTTFQILEITSITTAGSIAVVAFNSRGMCEVDTDKIQTPMASITFQAKTSHTAQIMLTGIVNLL